MEKVMIRKASLHDIDGIQNIHRDCSDPWHDKDECTAWVEKRLERDFYIQVAEINGKIVGHGEWIISIEPTESFLYLGMLQIDDDYQQHGIGRTMINDGLDFASEHHCSKIVTIPDTDNTSELFYEKCGFLGGRTIWNATLPTAKYGEYSGSIYGNFIPESVIKEQTFVFGLAQASSRHMWEVQNQKPKTDSRLTPALILNDGSCIQLSYFPGNDTALALCWSNSLSKEILKNILALGFQNGLKHINFLFFTEYQHFFEGVPVQKYDDELYKLT